MRKYVFENRKTKVYGIVELSEDGAVKGYSNPNESFWAESDETLTFFDANRRVTSVFKKTKDGDYCGDHLGMSKWHILKPYESVFPFTSDVSQYKTDKILHNLLPFYEQKFKYIREEKIKILEIGCLGFESIRYWLDYFPNGQIYGIDINESNFSHKRFQFFRADQKDFRSLMSIADKIGELDIVIDDAAHTYDETKNVFDSFWPRVKRGGYFIIEDWDYMTDLVTDIIQSRGPGLWHRAGAEVGVRGLKPVDMGIEHLEVSTNDNRAYALFRKR